MLLQNVAGDRILMLFLYAVSFISETEKNSLNILKQNEKNTQRRDKSVHRRGELCAFKDGKKNTHSEETGTLNKQVPKV
jgi:hypothetical protein